MGLAGPKRRTKMSADPNNTNWTKNTDSFGHRMLTSQGWTPGSFLGAKDANHSDHYTAANASHIRVLLKDDTLGLGASRKREGAETFGLDQFAGLLGRLNGKDSTVLKKEEDSRRDIKLRLWQEGKYGGMRFVSAGFLVGDEVKELRRTEVEAAARKSKTETQSSAKVAQSAVDPARGKKRKADGEVKEASSGSSDSTTDEEASPASKPEKSSKRQKKEDKETRRAEKEERRKQKAAKKLAKEERRQARELRRADKATKKAKRSTDTQPSSTTISVSATPVESSSDEEDTSRSNTPSAVMPRNNVRHRYIQQKRMAGLDPKALKEIFMIKTNA